VPQTPAAASYPPIRADLIDVNAGKRQPRVDARLAPFETLEAVSAEKKHTCYGECFVWLAADPVARTTCSPSSTSGSARATVARSRLPVSGSVK
jgi:hypothetical protein